MSLSSVSIYHITILVKSFYKAITKQTYTAENLVFRQSLNLRPSLETTQNDDEIYL
jgi:uncharacterized membrane protein